MIRQIMETDIYGFLTGAKNKSSTFQKPLSKKTWLMSQSYNTCLIDVHSVVHPHQEVLLCKMICLVVSF